MISKKFQMRLTVMSVVRSMLATSIVLSGSAAFAASDNSCRELPGHADFKAALTAARSFAGGNGGSTWTCGARSSTATAWYARWPSPAPIAAPNGRGAE
jgi:hypothetical protein